MSAEMPNSTQHEIEHDVRAHPGAKQYLVIATILTILTAGEVAVFYVPALASVLVYILVTLSAAKFALVVMFYMHLKFDSRIFSGVFLAPLALAVGVVISLIILFRVLPQI
ncbi:MAG TPA: cytochrome C oxidase subunit IV family protein [Longimicrobiales bacterium]